MSGGGARLVVVPTVTVLGQVRKGAPAILASCKAGRAGRGAAHLRSCCGGEAMRRGASE